MGTKYIFGKTFATYCNKNINILSTKLAQCDVENFRFSSCIWDDQIGKQLDAVSEASKQLRTRGIKPLSIAYGRIPKSFPIRHIDTSQISKKPEDISKKRPQMLLECSKLTPPPKKQKPAQSSEDKEEDPSDNDHISIYL